MKRINILNYLTLLLLFFCCTSCDSKRTMDNMKKTLFVWQPALMMPKYYLVYEPSMHVLWWNEHTNR